MQTTNREKLTVSRNKRGVPVYRIDGEKTIGSEDVHQETLTSWVRMNKGNISQLELYHHIPNGGRRDKKTAARLMGQGVKAGVPDVFIPAPSNGYHGIYIELKVDGNYATEAQNEFLCGVLDQGYFACICYGWRAAAEVIRLYFKPWESPERKPEIIRREFESLKSGKK